MFKALLVGLILLMSGALYADPDHLQVFNTSVLQWKDSPYIPGAKISVMVGDPTKKQYFVVRIKLPANFVVPPHYHVIDEYDTIVSGGYYVGLGKKVNSNNSIALKPGAFVIIPAYATHYGWTKQETILQVSGVGPWGTIKPR